MARKRKTSPAEDLLDLVSLLPWWAGVALAVVTYFVLHTYATSAPPATPVSTSQLGQLVFDAMGRTLATYAQYFLPLICLGGAIASAWKKHQRRGLIHDVSQGNAADALSGMSWQEFEMLVGEAFRLQGYRVIETGNSSGDGGVDLVLLKGSEKYLVQCKHWKAFKVGVDVVRELYGVMAAQGAAGGVVVTSGQFTDAATEFARGRNLKLVHGPTLLKLIQSEKSTQLANRPSYSATEQKTDSATPSCPRCAKPMIRRLAQKGASAGQAFWGCASYPGCKGTRPIS